MTLTPMVVVVESGSDRIESVQGRGRNDNAEEIPGEHWAYIAGHSTIALICLMPPRDPTDKCPQRLNGLGQSTVEDYLLLTCGSRENNESEPAGGPTIPICIASVRTFWSLRDSCWSATGLQWNRRHSPIHKCGLMMIAFDRVWFLRGAERYPAV